MSESSNYFVIAGDGRKYGPVDYQTLSDWKTEGRIDRFTWIESDDGSRKKGEDYFEFAGPVPQPVEDPPVLDEQDQTGIAQPPIVFHAQIGPIPAQNESITAAWVLCLFGAFCFPFLPTLIGISYARAALRNGNRDAVAPLIVGYIVLGWNVLAVLLIVGLIKSS